jgi:hypothetical protein
MDRPHKLSSPRKYKQATLVRFSGRFPIDMLRYDTCHPATEADAGKIERSFDDHDEVTVTVVRYAWAKDQKWTVDRWRSFGCTLEPASSWD